MIYDHPISLNITYCPMIRVAFRFTIAESMVIYVIYDQTSGTRYQKLNKSG
jgi:hypothetical protein